MSSDSWFRITNSDRIPKRDLNISTKRKFGKTPEMMDGFCFVVTLTCLNRPNPGKDKDDDDMMML
jgi:hypothetical protein